MKINFLTLFFLIFCWLVFSVQAQEVEQGEVIKVNTTLVSVPVVVSDRQGRYVSGLTQEDFTLYQDGTKQTISFFATEEEPLNVAILLDTSKSTKDVLGKIKDAAKDFIKLLQPYDRAMIVTFDSDVNVITPLSPDRKMLEKAIKNVKVGERVGTVMRDAVQEIVSRSFVNVKGRKAIILLTDGKDYGSYQTETGLLNDIEESDVMIYSVFYKTGINYNQRRMRGIFRGNFPRRVPDRVRNRQIMMDEYAMEFLEEMAEKTAGRFYEKDVTDLKKTFEIIADELRKQYRLGFYPKDSDESKTIHQLKVKVARTDVAVRSRTSYRSK